MYPPPSGRAERPRNPPRSVTGNAASRSASAAPITGSAPCPAPAGSRAVWTLRKAGGPEPVVYSVVHERRPGLSCPDRQRNGATCNHIMALAACGLIPALKSARPKKARSARPAAPAPAGPDRGPVAAGFARVGPPHGAELAGAPEPEEEGFRCAFCGDEFDPEQSRDPHFCRPCAEIGGGQ